MKERSFIFGDTGHLVGTITDAEHHSSTRPIVAVLTNSGVIPRFGPNRMNIRLAREFAAKGIHSVRFDLSGLGDSSKSNGQHTASEQWIRDTIHAMDLAEQQFGPSHFFMVGFCSGAEVAHWTALRDSRLRGAMLWDFLSLPTWKSVIYKIIYKIRRAGWSGIWQKLRALLARRIDRNAESEPTQANRPPLDSMGYAQRFQALCDRNVKLFFLYSGGEPESYTYKHQFRDMFKGHAFVNQVEYDQIYLSDHLISTPNAQDAFVQRTDQWVRAHILSTHD